MIKIAVQDPSIMQMFVEVANQLSISAQTVPMHTASHMMMQLAPSHVIQVIIPISLHLDKS